MKHITDDQLEKDLSIFSDLKEVSPPQFFYARLNARIEDKSQYNTLGISFSPILVICALTLLLFANRILLEKEKSLVDTNIDQNIEALAVSYDQTVSN